MVTTIVLVVLIVCGVYLGKKSYRFDALGFTMGIMFGLVLVIHLLSWVFKGHNYEELKTKRDSFQQTLDESRKRGNQYETATIIKEVSEFNQRIALEKYYNKTLFFDQYVDDRIEELEPIK